jgi:hypothetical protein
MKKPLAKQPQTVKEEVFLPPGEKHVFLGKCLLPKGLRLHQPDVESKVSGSPSVKGGPKWRKENISLRHKLWEEEALADSQGQQGQLGA